MTSPREAQLELLLTISEGLSRGSHEMLRVSPTDAMHAPSCGLAIRDAVEELKWMRTENERLRASLKQFRCTCDPGECVEYGERWASVCEKGEARDVLEGKP